MPDLALITYQQFIQLSFEVAAKIAAAPWKCDLIISINRGGAVFSRILSDYLDLDLVSIGMKSYADLNQTKSLVINQELGMQLQGRSVLIVDEVCDTGDTLVEAIKYAKSLGAIDVHTATLVVKPHASMKPDAWAWESSAWLVFPYEVRETFSGLKSELEKDPQLVERLRVHFTEIGVPAADLIKCGLPLKEIA
jgi:hypoxanthine phosphoribosyltransferase